MTTSPISNQATAAREGARKGNGEFGIQPLKSTDLDLAAAKPVEIEVGDEHQFGHDPSDPISYYSVYRDYDGQYIPQAKLRLGPLNDLLGAPDDAEPRDVFDALSGAQYNLVFGTLRNKYGFELDGASNEDGYLEGVIVADSMDYAPTEEHAVDLVYPDSARMINETDRGTYGSPYVGDELVARLEAQAPLVQSYTITDRHAITELRDDVDELIRAEKDGSVVSDRAASHRLFGRLVESKPPFGEDPYYKLATYQAVKNGRYVTREQVRADLARIGYDDPVINTWLDKRPTWSQQVAGLGGE